jgi:hypothetical protein
MLAQISSESLVGNLFLLVETAFLYTGVKYGHEKRHKGRETTSQEVYRTEGKFTIDLNIAARVSYPCDAPFSSPEAEGYAALILAS